MSNARFETHPAHGAAPRTIPGDALHLAETVGYGLPGGPPPYGPPTVLDTGAGAAADARSETVPDTGVGAGAAVGAWSETVPDTGADTAPGLGAAHGTNPGPGPLRSPGPRSSHRRRARCADRADRLRRLLPRALVVAFLAGGTAAFVAEDKAVRLDVDGRTRTLHTFADDVTELLAEEGVRVGPHDVVTPGPGTGLGHGDEVEVRHGRPLVLTLDGRRREVWTTADTVEGALRELGVRAEGARLSTSRSRRIGREGLALEVRTERTVTVMADGRARTIRTDAATVREAVDRAGVGLRGQDTLSVDPDSFPRDGQTVTVLRITDGREVRDELVPFDEVRVEDRSLPRGTEVVDRPGRPGVRRVTYALRTVNGVRQKPRRLHAEVVRAPRPQQVRVGTGTAPAPAGRLAWHRLALCESGGRPDAVDASGTYGGLYQFDTRTWQSLGGRGRPQDAPAEEQTYRAQQLYARSGTSPWPHCGPRLLD